MLHPRSARIVRDQNSLRRSTPVTPRIPEPNSTKLLGSGVVPPLVPLMSKDSGGQSTPAEIQPVQSASDGQPPPMPLSPLQSLPSFSSQYTGSPLGTIAFWRL